MYMGETKCASTGFDYQPGYVKVTIQWHEYIVPRHILPQLVTLLGDMRTLSSKKELEMVPFSVSESPDVAYEKMKLQATEDVKDTIGKELEQKTKWWLDERAKTQKLEKELAEANQKLAGISNTLSPKSDEETPF